MPHLESKYHERIKLEAYDAFYCDVAERDYNQHSNVTSPFDVWSVCKLRAKCDLEGARMTPTDVIVWGRGNGLHPAITRVGGVPAWSPGESLPTSQNSGLRFFGQFNLLDSIDVLPFTPKGLLSVWGSNEFPWEKGSVATFWVDPDTAILSPEFRPEHGFAKPGHAPYFGSLYRSWDPAPNQKFDPVAVDAHFEAHREYSPRSWNATKYGGIEHMPQWGSKLRIGWRFLLQFSSIQASPQVAFPWTTREKPLTMNFDKEGIYHKSNTVVIGDMGVISFSGTKSGKITSLFECG